MIIVLASPLVRGEPIAGGRQAAGIILGRRAAGLGVDIALAAATAGARVELVGKVGDDPAGDAIAVELERAGVGHAALLREPAARTPVDGADPVLPLGLADVELALSYLPDFRVIVAADVLADPVAEAVAAATSYGGGHRVLIGGGPTEDDEVTQLAAPASGHAARNAADSNAGFAAFVGRYAAFLDAGQSPADAFTTAARDVGWEPARHA
jgi:ribokinase